MNTELLLKPPDPERILLEVGHLNKMMDHIICGVTVSLDHIGLSTSPTINCNGCVSSETFHPCNEAVITHEISQKNRNCSTN